MTFKEFAALKLGDKIDNPMTQSQGEVVEVNDKGVRVRWGTGKPGKDVTFQYPVNSTAWMHWNKPEGTSETAPD
jgi:hypothetical protein